MNTQKVRQITMYVCTTAMIVLGIYDLIVVNTHGPDASISRFMQESIFASPILSFGLGALFGHFAMYFRPKWKDSELLIEEMGASLARHNIVTIELLKNGNVLYKWRYDNSYLKGQECKKS